MIENYVSRTTELFDSKAFMVDWTTYMMLSLLDMEDRDSIDVEKLKDCKAIFKKSAIRNHTTAAEVFITKMYLAENPVEYMERVDAIYKSFERKLFTGDWGSDFAALLYESSGKDVSEANEYFKKATEILKMIEKKQSFLDSVSFGLHDAMLIALSDREVDYYIKDMEDCVEKIKRFYKKVRDIAFALASPLALSYQMNWKVDEYMKIYTKYINKGIELNGVETAYVDKKNNNLLDVKYSTTFMNPDCTLNIYTIFAFYIVENVNFESSMPKIIEYYGKLRDVEGIGPTGKFLNWGENVTKEDALVYATLLVLLDSAKNKESIVLTLIGDQKLKEYIAEVTSVILMS